MDRAGQKARHKLIPRRKKKCHTGDTSKLCDQKQLEKRKMKPNATWTIWKHVKCETRHRTKRQTLQMTRKLVLSQQEKKYNKRICFLKKELP